MGANSEKTNLDRFFMPYYFWHYIWLAAAFLCRWDDRWDFAHLSICNFDGSLYKKRYIREDVYKRQIPAQSKEVWCMRHIVHQRSIRSFVFLSITMWLQIWWKWWYRLLRLAFCWHYQLPVCWPVSYTHLEHHFKGHYSGEEVNADGYTIYCNTYTPTKRVYTLKVKQ